MAPGPKRVPRLAKIVKTSTNVGTAGRKSEWSKWVLITILVALIALTLFYVYQLTKQSLKKKEGFENNQKPAQVILVHSPTCPHCRDFLPIFQAVQGKTVNVFGKDVVLSEVEASQAGELMSYVSGVPSVLIKDSNGVVVHTITGKRNETEFIDEVKTALAKL